MNRFTHSFIPWHKFENNKGEPYFNREAEARQEHTMDENTNTFGKLWSGFTDTVCERFEDVSQLSRSFFNNVENNIFQHHQAHAKTFGNTDGVTLTENEEVEQVNIPVKNDTRQQPNTSFDAPYLYTGDTAKTNGTKTTIVRPTTDMFATTKYIPFCEEYDGRPVYKSQTISGCIKDLIESRKKAQEALIAQQSVSPVKKGIFAAKTVEGCVVEKEYYQSDSEESISSYLDSEDSGSCAVSNIIPEMEIAGIITPHFRKRFFAKRKASVVENNYMQLKKQNSGIELLQSDKGTIQLTIQYLLSTQRLKVVIKSVAGISKIEGIPEKYSNVFVKACFMPREGKKQMKTQKVKGKDFVNFDKEIYFNDVAFESVHLLAIRFKVYVTTGRILPRKTCVAGSLVWLDEVNVVDKAVLVEKLRPYLEV